MASYKLSAAAKQDVTAIFIYTRRQFGKVQAELYKADLHACFEKLTQHPLLGFDATKICSDTRCALHGQHAIYYRAENDMIRIIRVLHQSMRPPAGL